MKTKIFKVLAGLLLAVAFGAAQAQTFTFSDMTKNAVAGTSRATESGYGVSCTDGDKCSSNVNAGVFGGVLTYTSGALTVQASGYFNASNNFNPFTSGLGTQMSVVQDHNSIGEIATGGAGLGVYHLRNTNSDDNITTGETLKMSFSQTVNLTGVGLRAEGHSATWAPGKTFLYSQDAINWTQGTLTANLALNLTGQNFYFRLGGSGADQFYLGTMTVAAVPEAETYAMMLVGLGVMGAMVRRRQQKRLPR